MKKKSKFNVDVKWNELNQERTSGMPNEWLTGKTCQVTFE